ncbi:hypothetical protein GH714_043371 [Hevea brasiliensis]|uniref:phospholipase D n=1 Tax=Hevea brasiliensis TaxID=3981 RepID=A0A6A6K2S1_HEVBR|nr:hypothetical protein GH714_043371 [Hevea brasiliensis]
MPSLLHGTLSVTIFEVDRIQNGCGFNFFSKGTGQKSCGKKFLSKVKRMVLCRPEIVGSRLYATVDLDKARVGRTRMIENQPYNPQWYESFNIYCAHLISHVIFTVKDDQVVGAELIGRAYIPVEDVIKGYIVDKWVDILDVNRNPIGSRIHVKLHFLSAAHDSNWDPHRRKPGGDLKLGDLLKKKADEGVRVLMLVWDDRTSVEELKKDGLMATHDQETENYFRNTNVHCFLCPRNPDNGRSIIQGFEISTMFTHHQKTVVVDCEMPDSTSQKRRIVSFVGGIDLCDGRYDTQDHPLFKTLDTIHHDDFHQPNFPGSSIKKGGPREPWHDIHCKLEGPVAWDVLYNFEQRWKKQVGESFLIPQQTLEEYTTAHCRCCNHRTLIHGMSSCSVPLMVELLLASLRDLRKQLHLALSVGRTTSSTEAFKMLISTPFGGQRILSTSKISISSEAHLAGNQMISGQGYQCLASYPKGAVAEDS